MARMTSREAWRRWLASHHQDKKKIRLIFYKRASAQPSISFDDLRGRGWSSTCDPFHPAPEKQPLVRV